MWMLLLLVFVMIFLFLYLTYIVALPAFTALTVPFLETTTAYLLVVVVSFP